MYTVYIHVFKQPCMQAEYHANVYTVTVSNDKQNIQH